MRALFLFIVFALMTVEAKEGISYIGSWSNGRGEVLVITDKTVQFASNKPVRYRDITRASDGHYFQLQLEVGPGVNFFTKFMSLTLKGKGEMHTEGYDAIADEGSDNASSQNWFRD